MPRHGNTRRQERNHHQGHRVHKRSRAVRRAARMAQRPQLTWDRAGWLERMHEEHHLTPARTAELVAILARPEMGRKNQPVAKPQSPKPPKGGSKGGQSGTKTGHGK